MSEYHSLPTQGIEQFKSIAETALTDGPSYEAIKNRIEATIVQMRAGEKIDKSQRLLVDPYPSSGHQTVWMVDELTMAPGASKWNAKHFTEGRIELRKRLELFLRGRQVILIGLTRRIPFKDGSYSGHLETGVPYRIAADEFIAIKMDPTRSRYVVVLEPNANDLFYVTQRALFAMYPRTNKNLLLNPLLV